VLTQAKKKEEARLHDGEAIRSYDNLTESEKEEVDLLVDSLEALAELYDIDPHDAFEIVDSIAEELNLTPERVITLLAEKNMLIDDGDLNDEPAPGRAPAPTSIEEVNSRLRSSARERIEEARVDIRTKAAR
jgi:hypothetical protein